MLQAGEAPVMVLKDGCPANRRNYMWIYHTEKINIDTSIVLYEYQGTCKADNLGEFLKRIAGVVVCDSYFAYSRLAGKIRISFLQTDGHMQDDYFSDVLKALTKAEQNRKGHRCIWGAEWVEPLIICTVNYPLWNRIIGRNSGTSLSNLW